MDIKIDSGVPLPEKANATKYPFREMAVGDSFFVPGKKSGDFSGQVAQAKKATGFNFTTRTLDGGVRVWRVS